MKHFNRFFAAFLVTLLLALLSACAPNLAVSTVTPTPEAVQTAAPTASPSRTPIVEPTPDVDEYGFTKERKAELNQQIQDFLNYRSEFTRKKMSSLMMESATKLDRSEVGLGVASSTPEAQGYFFDFFEKDHRLFLLMGFDGQDGHRFVTLVAVPLYVYEQFGEAEFSAIEYKKNSFFEFNDASTKIFHGRDEIICLLNNLKSRVIVLSLNVWTFDVSDVESFGQVAIDYVHELNSKIDLSFELFRLMTSNDIHYDNMERIVDPSSIINLQDLDYLEEIKESQVPIVQGVIYFEGIIDHK